MAATNGLPRTVMALKPASRIVSPTPKAIVVTTKTTPQKMAPAASDDQPTLPVPNKRPATAKVMRTTL